MQTALFTRSHATLCPTMKNEIRSDNRTNNRTKCGAICAGAVFREQAFCDVIDHTSTGLIYHVESILRVVRCKCD